MMSYLNLYDSTRMNFTNKELDRDLELNYFGARYYQPEFPRFLSPDPVGGTPEVPISWNRYLYCRNDPINMIDPDGECAVAAVVIGAAAIGGVALVTAAIVSDANFSEAVGDVVDQIGDAKDSFDQAKQGFVSKSFMFLTTKALELSNVMQMGKKLRIAEKEKSMVMKELWTKQKSKLRNWKKN